jgi:hypothetical protein
VLPSATFFLAEAQPARQRADAHQRRDQQQPRHDGDREQRGLQVQARRVTQHGRRQADVEHDEIEHLRGVFGQRAQALERVAQHQHRQHEGEGIKRHQDLSRNKRPMRSDAIPALTSASIR